MTARRASTGRKATKTVSKRRSGTRRTPSLPKSVAGAARHAEAQNAVYVAPWFVLMLAPVFGQVLYGLATASGRQSLLIVLVLIVVATAGTAYAGYHDTHERSAISEAHTLVTILLSGAWLALCAATGFVHLADWPFAGWQLPIRPVLHYPALVTWAIAGGALAIAWNMRQGQYIADLRAAEAAKDAPGDPWTEAGHAGVTGKLKRINEFRSEGVLTLPKGDTLDSIQKNKGVIESAHDWPPGSASFTHAVEWNRARKVKVVVMHKDPLIKSTVWPGLETGRRRTMLDPMPAGIRSDGEVATMRLFTPEGGRHGLVMGMTGAGKTEGEKPVLITSAHRGADIILIDTVKRLQSYGKIADIFQMFETDPARAKAIVKALVNRTVPERTNALADEGLSEWSARSKLRPLYVHIEEAWSLVDLDELVELGVALRSAGGRLTVSLQRATYDQMPVSLRGQLGLRRCYGLMEDSDAGFALSDQLLDAVARTPDIWADGQPGMHYLQQSGVALAQQIMPVRTYTDVGAPQSFVDAAITVGQRLHTADPVTVASLGDLWTSRTLPRDIAQRVRANADRGQRVEPQRETATPGPMTGRALTTSADQVADDSTAAGSSGDEVMEGEVVMEMNEDGSTVAFTGSDDDRFEVDFEEPDPDPAHPPNPDEVIEDQPTDREPIRMGKQVDKASQVEFDAAMERTLDELLASGATQIRATDFVAVAIETGWSRASIYTRLDKWAADDRLVRQDNDRSGVCWMPVPSGARA